MDKVIETLETFNEECKDFLHVSLEVPVIDYDPSNSDWNLMFYREYVSKNIPVKIRNGFDNMQALKLWNIEYFLDKMADKQVIVAVTPNGYADGLLNLDNLNNEKYDNMKSESTDGNIFVLPEEVTMTMKEFTDNLKQPKPNYVCYIQRQDSNFTEDFFELWHDVKPLSWAETAFGKLPDAVNFWMGDSRAITCMHKDFYENIYCVIDGFKDFILIPPTDLPNLTYKQYNVAKFQHVSEDSFNVELQKDENSSVNTVPWLANDPLDNKIEVDKFNKASIYKVRVEKGECLYLPSLWFHHVQQSHGCIALNYWYDMEFDVKWCYYKMLEKLCS